jgi:hypothetical protein
MSQPYGNKILTGDPNNGLNLDPASEFATARAL